MRGGQVLVAGSTGIAAQNILLHQRADHHDIFLILAQRQDRGGFAFRRIVFHHHDALGGGILRQLFVQRVVLFGIFRADLRAPLIFVAVAIGDFFLGIELTGLHPRGEDTHQRAVNGVFIQNAGVDSRLGIVRINRTAIHIAARRQAQSHRTGIGEVTGFVFKLGVIDGLVFVFVQAIHEQTVFVRQALLTGQRVHFVRPIAGLPIVVLRSRNDLDRAAVGHHIAVEAKGLAQQRIQQIVAAGRRHAVDHIVRAHHRVDVGALDDILKCAGKILADVLVGHRRGTVLTVVLAVVGSVVLQRGDNLQVLVGTIRVLFHTGIVFALITVDKPDGDLRSQEIVLAVALVVTTPTRVAAHVDGGAPVRQVAVTIVVVGARLIAGSRTDRFDQLRIPRCRHRDGIRERRGEFALALLGVGHTVQTLVPETVLGDTEPRDRRRRVAQLGGFFRQCQPRHQIRRALLKRVAGIPEQLAALCSRRCHRQAGRQGQRHRAHGHDRRAAKRGQSMLGILHASSSF